MVHAGKHQTPALCHTAAALLTRLAARWKPRRSTSYATSTAVPVDKDQARAIIADRYTIPAQLRNARATTGKPAKQGVPSRSIDRPVHHPR